MVLKGLMESCTGLAEEISFAIREMRKQDTLFDSVINMSESKREPPSDPDEGTG